MKAKLLSAEIVVVLLAVMMISVFLPADIVGPAEAIPAGSDVDLASDDSLNHIRPPPVLRL